MKTDELIATLAAHVEPARPGAVRDRLALGVLIAAVAGLALVLVWLGMRPDLHIAMRTSAFWIKAGYTLALAGCGFALTLNLGRPGARPGGALAIAPVAFAGLAGLAAVELLSTPSGHRMADWLGSSWQVCPFLIMVVSAPAFLAVVWALRGMAPTRLRQAGAAAGLLAGGVGASAYGLHCPETAAAFVVTWYSLGIAASVAIGAALGPRLLRW